MLLTRGPFVLPAREGHTGVQRRHFTFSFKALLQIVPTRDFIPSYLADVLVLQSESALGENVREWWVKMYRVHSANRGEDREALFSRM